MNIIYEKPTAEDYVSLRIRSGMGKKDIERSRIAIENSLFTASIYDDDKLIAFGRVVGDNGITYVVSDVMVDENYRRKGYANRIMDVIDEYLDINTFEDSYISLIANSPADCIYSKHKFEYLPKGKCGMLRNQNKF
ncbi:GNAT family N-acetyltransferase [Clostridium sp. ATCC 25772]|uniref:GNAT family N-acetyltransferase n=1 Tax=Clostridium sp. ATCC 25772 TaxID=1676991 RepID=UPI000780CE7E|nr:GNAT family N-acetyltransferase [Clostridium sp. ATCC 25772]